MPRPAIPDEPNKDLTPYPHRLLFIQHASVFEHFGGIEYYLDDLVTMAVGVYGNENVRVVAPVNGPPLMKRSYQTSLVARSKKSWIRKLENRFFGGLYRQASALIEKQRPTLLVNSHVSLGPLVYLLSRRYRIPYATIVYGIEAWGDLWPQDEWSLRKASGIISISQWTKEILLKRKIPVNHIHIIHPGLTEQPPSTIPVRRPSQTVKLLTVSRLDFREQYKGHDDVLKALSILKKTKPELLLQYVIQGEGTDRERLRKLTHSLDLSDRVEFRNSVKDRQELNRSYQSADIFIMPARFGRWNGAWRGEGFGIVYVEAAIFGVPSIAYRCGGATDIIQHAETGWLVEPDNIFELANTIAKAASDLSVVRKLGIQAQKSARARFTLEPLREELIRSFNALKS